MLPVRSCKAYTVTLQLQSALGVLTGNAYMMHALIPVAMQRNTSDTGAPMAADHCTSGILGARAQDSRAIYGSSPILPDCQLGAGVPALGAFTEAGVIQRFC